MLSLNQKANEVCGFAVDLNSVTQVSAALYDRLKLVPVRRAF